MSEDVFTAVVMRSCWACVSDVKGGGWAKQRGGKGKGKGLGSRKQSLEEKFFSASFFSGSSPKTLGKFFRHCLGSILIPKESHS